jgi:hypothetical protein
MREVTKKRLRYKQARCLSGELVHITTVAIKLLLFSPDATYGPRKWGIPYIVNRCTRGIKRWDFWQFRCFIYLLKVCFTVAELLDGIRVLEEGLRVSGTNRI